MVRCSAAVPSSVPSSPPSDVPSPPWQGAAVKPLLASIVTGVILWFVSVPEVSRPATGVILWFGFGFLHNFGAPAFFGFATTVTVFFGFAIAAGAFFTFSAPEPVFATLAIGSLAGAFLFSVVGAALAFDLAATDFGLAPAFFPLDRFWIVVMTSIWNSGVPESCWLLLVSAIIIITIMLSVGCSRLWLFTVCCFCLRLFVDDRNFSFNVGCCSETSCLVVSLVFCLGYVVFCLDLVCSDLRSFRISLFVRYVWVENLASADLRRPWQSAEFTLSCPQDFVLRLIAEFCFGRTPPRSMTFVSIRSPFVPLLCHLAPIGSTSFSVWSVCFLLVFDVTFLFI